MSSIHRFLKKIPTNTFDETSLGEIICEMHEIGKKWQNWMIIQNHKSDLHKCNVMIYTNVM